MVTPMKLRKEKRNTKSRQFKSCNELKASSMGKTLNTLLEKFKNEGYSIQIVSKMSTEDGGNDLTIKLRKKSGLTIYMGLLPKLDGSRKLSVIKISDGSVIERFMHTKIPPTEINDIVCPHFLELKWAYGCPFNCAYCYLQGTLRPVSYTHLTLPTN